MGDERVRRMIIDNTLTRTHSLTLTCHNGSVISFSLPQLAVSSLTRLQLK